MIRLLLLVCLITAQGALAGPNVAFFYGKSLPADELRAFDIAVVDPLSEADPKTFNSTHSELFAYVSVGEVHPSRAYVRDLPAGWLIGENPIWHSRIVDQAAPEWPEFFLERVIAPLWQRGYRGFFFDALDSFRLVATTPAQRRAQEQGLARVIELTKSRYPNAKLIFNRGFEILPAVGKHAYAIAAESLFDGWDQRSGRYVEVTPGERESLVRELTAAKTHYGLPVIVIDYVRIGERARARRTANQIKALGFIPWVTSAELDQLGVGAIEVMPRKVLMLYDSEQDPNLVSASIHRLATMPLNYLGYVAEYRDIRRGLPEYPLVGRYAGVVTWFHADIQGSARLRWLGKQAGEGVRIAMFDSFGLPPGDGLVDALGIHAEVTQAESTPPRVVERSPPVGYEIQPIIDKRRFMPVKADGARALLRLQGESGKQMEAVAYTPWGGYALMPYAAVDWISGAHEHWVIDPFAFLAEALKLPSMPVPDTTTENGRRLLMVHVDGDGFANRAWMPRTPFASDVLLREILQRYRVPTTMSVIQGETAANGLYPQFSAELENTARSMFALPHVELASHSYSHPFRWRQVGSGADSGQYNLGISGYTYDARTEIAGSIDYIDSRLAPAGKKSKVFLWSGDTDPDEEALAEAARAGVGNMNGGDTTITRSQNTLTLVAPLGLQKGEFYQVYAPNQNENVYTNLWTGPFSGYERVIETFELTELPRRLKPINIYYHTYAASKLAGLKALKKVYDWALAQPTMPVYASEYIEKVLDFNRVVVALDEDGWRVRGPRHLRQMRIEQSAGYPDLRASQGVIGWRDHAAGRYVHLSGEEETIIALSAQASASPRLTQANAVVSGWRRDERGVSFALRGHVPVEFALAGADGCEVAADGKPLSPQRADEGEQRFRLDDHVVERLVVRCPH